jgi:MFS family permease
MKRRDGIKDPVPRTSFRRNIPLFIVFRVLFNARWYYPVLAVLFLDLGLTVEQYALLNVAWAAAIVGLEVPSGALADFLGRKRMVVFASILMIVEMAVLAFAPRGNPELLFWVFLLNRILSGAAEASASGADEALAYDSLAADHDEQRWPQVLERVMRWQSVGFFIVMIVGAAIYDAGFVQRVIGFLGLPWEISKDIATRLPALFTLANAILVLFAALAMREPPVTKIDGPANPWKSTLAAGRWIWITPAAFVIILSGLTFDSIIRLFLTFESGYFRIIQLPTASFGIIGAAFSLLGFIVPAMARKMVAGRTMRTNFIYLGFLVFIGLAGISFSRTWYGLIWIIPIAMGMSFTQFFVSHYLNEQVTDSGRRATILSFRGLAFNLGYGMIGVLFAALTKSLSDASPGSLPDQTLDRALLWLPWYFLVTMLLLSAAAAVRMRRG